MDSNAAYLWFDGLLEGSFRLQADLVALRTLLRHRSQLVEHRSPHILHIQKALLQMNVQFSQAVTDIMGLTGQKIIRAILTGERDPQTLAAMREPGCKKSEEEIGKALTGTWREERLFVLNQSILLYDFYSQQIQACDEGIERLYGLTRPDWEAGEVEPFTRRKKNSHSKNLPQHAEEIRKHLKRISGVVLSVVDGFGVSLAQTVIMEVGTDTPAPTAGAVCLNFPMKSISVHGWVQPPSTLAPRCGCSAGVRSLAGRY